MVRTPDEILAELQVQAVYVPTRWKHLKRGTFYQVVSEGQYSLTTISKEGSQHEFFHNGVPVTATLQFSGGGGYGGPIVIYYSEVDNKFWIRPHFEFHDGRFEKVEA